MFGLRNKNGSCWINAALQAVFRIPDLQTRFNENEEDTTNTVETCLAELWGSKGEEGLKAFYECVKTAPNMPAGEDIGDSHELIEFLADKVPFLDKLMRFRVANMIKCNTCSHQEQLQTNEMRSRITQTKSKWWNRNTPITLPHGHFWPRKDCLKCSYIA
jgi:ubiquitin C-terminal hydrolase